MLEWKLLKSFKWKKQSNSARLALVVVDVVSVAAASVLLPATNSFSADAAPAADVLTLAAAWLSSFSADN